MLFYLFPSLADSAKGEPQKVAIKDSDYAILTELSKWYIYIILYLKKKNKCILTYKFIINLGLLQGFL